MKFFPRTWGLASLLLAAPLTAATSPGADQKPQNAPLSDLGGSLLDAELIGAYSAGELSEKVESVGFQARNGVKLYRISYLSNSLERELTTASGLILLPDTSASVYPWISLQHGTIAAKASAPSLVPNEGLVEASQGFVAVVADYLGYGGSKNLFHPYIIAQGYEDSNVAMLRAARAFALTQAVNLGPLFLKGYSEGGYATMALQRALETKYRDEFPLTAVSSAAGPYEPRATGQILMAEKNVNPVNVPFLILSYDHWLSAGEGLDLADIFVPSVAEVQATLSGYYDNEQVKERLPTVTADMFRADFLKDFARPDGEEETSNAKRLHSWLNSQSLLIGHWVPQTQTRLYHCRDDEEVPVENTELALAHFLEQSAKAPVTAVYIASPDPERPYRHGNCPAIFSPLRWFQEILESRADEGSP